MEYEWLDQSWELEQETGNLINALRLIKKQVSSNIVRFLNQFRDKLQDEDNGIFDLIQDGIPFKDEIKEIIFPFLDYQNRFYEIDCMEELLLNYEDPKDEDTAQQNPPIAERLSDQSLRRLIKEYVRLEERVSERIALFDEEAALKKLEEAIPSIIGKLEAVMCNLDTVYLKKGNLLLFSEAYCAEIKKASIDPIKALQKIASISNYILRQERAERYFSSEKKQKLQTYQKLAIRTIQILLVSESQMCQLLSDWPYVYRENIPEIMDMQKSLKNYSLSELISKAIEAIQEMKTL